MNQASEIASHILSRTAFRPRVGIICGSGLSELAKCMDNPEIMPYTTIPGFPTVTVSGHTGELVFGTIGGIACVCMRGRFHCYEGYTMETVSLPVRVMRQLGVQVLIVTNAAGGLNPDFNVGDIMVIQDHFGMPSLCEETSPQNLGESTDHWNILLKEEGCYDPKLQDMVINAASYLNLSSYVRPNGTYCFVCGPTYESKTEARFLRSIGGDSVGASTVPEVIAAKHCGMRILGLSLITNKVVVGKEDTPAATHQEVLEAVNASGMHVEAIVRHIITKNVMGPYLDALPEPVYVPAASAGHGSAADTRNGASNGETGSYREEIRSYFTNSMLVAISTVVVGICVVVSRSRR